MSSWKTVRVFISSTFRDMHSERDHLVRFVFPELKELCARRRLHLVDVDLRWGVTEEESKQGKALEACLDEIERCRPFFIGLLGERYGWVPSKYEVPDEPQYMWLRKLDVGHSVTALEIYHGVLRNQEMNTRAFFYFRDPAFLSGVPESLHKEFLTESPDAQRKLRALKGEIEQRYPVFKGYHCLYGGTGEDGSAQLVELELFGQQVLKDLWSAITLEYPAEDAQADDLGLERAYHESFIEERSRSFIGRHHLLNELAACVDRDGAMPIVVTGTPGSGKSALMAEFANRITSSKPDTFVLSHFIGVSPGSTDIRRTLLRLCRELKLRFGLNDDIPTDYYRLRQTFLEFIEQGSALGKIVLLIDALNQLEETQSAHNLDWLPQSLPRGVTLIVSTLTGDCLDALQARAAPSYEIVIGPLTNDERKEIVRQMLWTYRKRLDERSDNDQIGALLSKVDSDNPLYLRVACEEMRVFGDFERVTERIESLPDRVPALLEQVLERIEIDYGKELVADLLSLLACSRHGLLESELLELLAPSGQARLPQARWASLYRSLKFYLRPPGEDGEGELDFFHRQLAKAVRQRYFNHDESEVAGHERLARYFQRRIDTHSDNQWTAIYPRGLRELPYHLCEGALYSELFQLARDNGFMQAQARAFPNDPELQMDVLQQAIKGAAHIDDAVRMAEFSLTHARRLREITRESPLTALRAGNLQRAWELADLNEVEYSILWHLLLAWELSDEGLAAEARETLERLRRRARPELAGWQARCLDYLLAETSEIDVETIASLQLRSLMDKEQRDLTDRQKETLRKIVEAQARAGDFAGAIKTAQTIDSEWDRDMALEGIARNQARLGEFRGAAESLSTVIGHLDNATHPSDVNKLARLLKELAVIQAQAGDFKRAAATARSIKENEMRVEAMAKLAEVGGQAGDFESAMEAATTIEAFTKNDERRQLSAFLQIATRQMEAGDNRAMLETLAVALGTIRAGHSIASRATGLAEIGVLQIKAGAESEAQATFALAIDAAQINKNDTERLAGLAEIGVLQAKAGAESEAQVTFARAVEAARINKNDTERSSALKAIAVAQAQAANWTGAIETAESCGRYRAEALEWVARAQAEAGRLQEAKDTALTIWNRDHSATQPADDYLARLQERTLGYIAGLQAKTGDFINALEQARGIKDAKLRATALSEIADAQAHDGQRLAAIESWSAAVEAARNIKYENGRTSELKVIAVMQLRAGEILASRNTFAMATTEMPDELALMQLRGGDLKGGINVINSITNWQHRTSGLKEIIEAQAESGDLIELIQIVNRIEDEELRASALEEVARAQTAACEFQSAIETVSGLGNRASILVEIAIAQSSVGQRVAARNTLVLALQSAYGYKTGSSSSREGHRRADTGTAVSQLKSENKSKTPTGFAFERQAKNERQRAKIPEKIERLRNEIASSRKELADENVRWDEWGKMLAGTGAGYPAGLSEVLGEIHAQHQATVTSATGKIRTAQVEMARGQLKLGDLKGAIETVHSLADGDDRRAALREIATLELESGQLRAALDVLAAAIKSESYGPSDLGAIANVQASAGEKLAAQSTLGLALEAARGTYDEDDRASAVAQVAMASVTAGFNDLAVQAAGTILTNRDHLLPDVAAALVAAKDKAHFKRLLIPCAYYTDAASRMCELMALLYPEQADGIANELTTRG